MEGGREGGRRFTGAEWSTATTFFQAINTPRNRGHNSSLPPPSSLSSLPLPPHLASTVVHGMARSGSSWWLMLAKATSKLSSAAVLLSPSPPSAGGAAAGEEEAIPYPVCLCVYIKG